ncbi:MAG TPA: glutaredoxin domain-containing protein [Blastocatellia bacterium]|nr:glutaredoxin domain-containing protein [Blastocatellia bacterium]
MTLKMYTTVWCPDCHAAKRFLQERGIAYEEINIESTPGAADLVKKINNGKRSVPTFVTDDKSFNCSPFDANKMKTELGLS